MSKITAIASNGTKQQRIDVRRASRLASAPMSAKGILTRCWAGNSRTTAVKAMCLDCVGFDRKAVTECAAYACPLWEYRPYQTKDETDEPTE